MTERIVSDNDTTMPPWSSLVIFTDKDAIGSYRKLIGKVGIYRGLRAFKTTSPMAEINFENSRSTSVFLHQIKFISDPVDLQVGDMVYYSTSHPDYVGKQMKIVEKEVNPTGHYTIFKVLLNGQRISAYASDLIPVYLPNKEKKYGLERGD